MSQKGFTLVELAIVIAIVAVLGAVAIPSVANMTGRAEAATIQDMRSQLQSGIAMYMAGTGNRPAGLNRFVTAQTALIQATPTGAAPNQDFRILSVQDFGPNSRNTPCVVAANTLTCSNGTFSNFRTVQYTYSAALGTVTLTRPTAAEINAGSN